MQEAPLIRVQTIRRRDLEQIQTLTTGSWEFCGSVVLRDVGEEVERVLDILGWCIKDKGVPGRYLLLQERGTGTLYKVQIPHSAYRTVGEGVPQIFVR